MPQIFHIRLIKLVSAVNHDALFPNAQHLCGDTSKTNKV
jgi:hypothetical protein